MDKHLHRSMTSSDVHHDLEAEPSSSQHEPTVRRASDNTPIPSDLTNNTTASASLPKDPLHLIRALAYVVQLILLQLRDAPYAVVRHIRQALPFARHTNDALLPQFTEPVTSGSDPPSLSSDSFRDAVISSFISNSSSVVPEDATERTPLLSSNSHPNDTSTSSRRPPHLKIRVTDSDSPDIGVCGEPLSHPTSGAVPEDHITSASDQSNSSTNPGLDDSTPSASSLSTDSSPSCSTPSSSNSSFVMLRSALKTPSPSMSAHPSPRLGLLRLGFGGETIDGLTTGRSSPVPKAVRFNEKGNETHFFEYAPHEEHETKSLKTPTSTMGRWKKNGGTIVWQVSKQTRISRYLAIVLTTIAFRMDRRDRETPTHHTYQQLTTQNPKKKPIHEQSLDVVCQDEYSIHCFWAHDLLLSHHHHHHLPVSARHPQHQDQG